MGLPYIQRLPVIARFVVIMDMKRADRALRLIDVPSRAIRRGEIHELILTDETPENGIVNRVAYLGFAEFLTGGVIVPGDKVIINGRTLGTLLGFDETHMPNHYNVVVQSTEPLQTGKELGLNVGHLLAFYPGEE